MANFMIVAAGSGIGQSLTALLQARGDRVFTTARNSERIDPDITLDATDFEATEAAFKAASEKLGALDGAVNCAGSLHLRPAHATSRAQYDETIAASLTTAFATVRAAGKTMKAGGSVVLISSGAALSGHANHEAIAAAKGGVAALVQSAAASYAGANLRFNAVAPGLVETPMTADLTQNATSRKVSEAMHPLGRLGTPDHIARAIAFLLDPQNDWITGQILPVDGGLSSVRPKLKV